MKRKLKKGIVENWIERNSRTLKTEKNLFVYEDFFLKSGLKRRKKENQIRESKKKKNFLNYVKKTNIIDI